MEKLSAYRDEFNTLAEDFIEVRRMPRGDERESVYQRLLDRTNGICIRVWENGGFQPLNLLIKESWETAQRREHFGDTYIVDLVWQMRMFETLVGYRVLKHEVIASDVEEEGDIIAHYSLEPGIIAKVVSGFPSYELGIFTDATDAEDAVSENWFEVVGYLARGCRVLAEMVSQDVGNPSLPSLMPPGKNPQRLIRGFWREANWKTQPPACDIRKICREIWPEESNTDLESLVAGRIRKTISDTNTKLLELDVAITFRKVGDIIEMEDHRQ